MSQQNGWMTHSISTCASCKQITFINTSHTPDFFQNVLLVACDGVSKPRTGGWKTTKNCTDFRQANTFVWGLSPAPAGDNSRAAATLGGAVGGSGSGGGQSDSPKWEFQPRELLPPLPVGAAPGAAQALLPSAAQPKGKHVLGQSPCSSYRSPLISPTKAQMNPFKCKLALHF